MASLWLGPPLGSSCIRSASHCGDAPWAQPSAISAYSCLRMSKPPYFWYSSRPRLIYEEGVGHGLEAEQPAQQIVFIDQGGVGGSGLFDVGTGLLGALCVHGHGYHLNALVPVLGVELLPHGQLGAGRLTRRPT